MLLEKGFEDDKVLYRFSADEDVAVTASGASKASAGPEYILATYKKSGAITSTSIGKKPHLKKFENELLLFSDGALRLVPSRFPLPFQYDCSLSFLRI